MPRQPTPGEAKRERVEIMIARGIPKSVIMAREKLTENQFYAIYKRML